ncbi:MAG TPA: ATP-binding protein [Vicinamibacterales bacterium]|nr:ATP-binding protein [Vicinamibacterales bacterium]
MAAGTGLALIASRVLALRRGVPRAALEEVRAEEARFRSLVESAPDAIVAVDARGCIVLANAQAEQIFGYGRAELKGKPVEVLLPESLRETHVAQRRQFQAQPRRRPMGLGLDLQGRRKDGSVFPTEISLSPLQSPDGPVVVAFIRDITERKRIDDERAKWMREEAASRAKDDFVAVVSHELRTPLNAILGWTVMLKANSADEETTAKAISTIERNARAQMQLIDDLLDMSRIIAGKLRLDIQDIELLPVLQAAADTVRPAAETKSIQLETAIAPGIPRIPGDPARLQQVVWNLLSNAVKFTPTGGAVRLTAEPRGPEVEVRVSDSGQGIHPSLLPHIFERFRQGDENGTSPQGGLGLGLAIVRDIVKLHRGRIEAHSDGPGTGASFIVTLPAAG